MSKIHVYLAGGLFNEAERAYNTTLAKEIRYHVVYKENSVQSFEVFVPQETEFDVEKQGQALYVQETEQIKQSNVVVALLEGEALDSGTCFEIGYARALNIPVIVYTTDVRWFKWRRLNNMFRECTLAAGGIDALFNALQAVLPAS